MLIHDSFQDPSQQRQPPSQKVTVSVKVETGSFGTVIYNILPSNKLQIQVDFQFCDTAFSDKVDKMALLECPMCEFAVLPTDDYILQLHFEQVHTTDSPFKIDDDPEPLLQNPSLKREHMADTPSSDEEASTATCPYPDCGETVLLTDLNDHLDYHAAETLSFDETTGKYHSHCSSATMPDTVIPQRQGTPHPKDLYSEHSFAASISEGSKDQDGHHRRHKKHRRRPRSHTVGSEKSTLSRSIISCNPFTKPEKAVKPPSKSARLGVSISSQPCGSCC